MTFQKRRPFRFTSAFAVTLVAFAGGCAMQKPAAQIAKTPIADKQNAPIQTPQIVVEKLAERRVYEGVVAALQFSPDGARLASAGGTTHNRQLPDWLTGQLKVIFLDAQNLRSTKTLPLLPEANYIVFSPDLKRIVTNPSVYQGLQLFDATNGKSLWRQFTNKPDYPPLPNGADALMSIMKLAISPGGDKVLTCNKNGRFVEGYVDWWFLEQQKLRPSPDTEETDITNVPGLNDEVLCYRAAFSPDSKTYIIGSRENTLALIDIKANKMMWAQEKYYQDEKFVKPDNDAVIANKVFVATGMRHPRRP